VRGAVAFDKRTRKVLSAVSLYAAVSFFPSGAGAFYESRSEDHELDVRGLLRVALTNNDNPDIPSLYKNRTDQTGFAIGRLMADAKSGDSLGFEMNVYQTFLRRSSDLATAGFIYLTDVERSSALSRTVVNDPAREAFFEVDRLNARFSMDRYDLTVGRQAINLATAFYFTPNDFFAPFNASTFYRLYKPGVDAVRLEVR